MIDAKDNKALDYFSFKEDTGYIYYATYSETVITENGTETDRIYEMSENSRSYASAANMCSMPYNFLFNLIQMSENPEYVMAVIDLLLEDTEVVFMIQDQMSVSTQTHVETSYHAKKTVEEEYRERSVIEDGEVVDQYWDYIDSEESYDYPYGEPVILTVVKKVYGNTTTEFIQKANTWCMDFEQEATANNTDTLGDESVVNEVYSQSDLEGLSYHHVSTSERENGSRKTETHIYSSDEALLDSTSEKIDTQVFGWTVAATTEKKINHEKFLGLWKNDKGEYYLGAKYDPNGKLVGYRLPEDVGIAYPVKDMTNEQGQNINDLIDLLSTHVDTELHEELMMYYWNIYYGEDVYKVDVDNILNLFNENIFVPIVGIGSGGASYETLEISELDIEYLARTVYAERGNGTQEQQEHIASVILNRVLSSKFPNTVYGVISQKGQFSSFQNHNYNSNGYLRETTQAAVKSVIEHGDTTGGAIYFMTPEAASRQKWLVNCIFLFNDETGEIPPTVGGKGWTNTSSYYTTESAQAELSQFATSSSFNGQIYQYYQGDWAHVPYGSGTVANCGCGVTATAMVISTLLDKPVTPADIVAWAGNRHYTPGYGTSYSMYSAAAKHYGTGSVRQTGSINDVINALSSGKLVISSQKRGLFTLGNHLIVLYKIENNLIYVCDPNKNNAINKGYNNRGFTPSEIHASAKQYFIFE